MLFAAPDMETSIDGNTVVNFFELKSEGFLKAVRTLPLAECFAEGLGWVDAFPTTACSSSAVLLRLPEFPDLKLHQRQRKFG